MKTFNDVPTSILAKKLGISQSYVSNMKHGRTAVPPEIAIAIFDHFGIHPTVTLPDIYPRRLFEVNDASNHNTPPRPVMEGANE